MIIFTIWVLQSFSIEEDKPWIDVHNPPGEIQAAQNLESGPEQ